MKRKRYGATGVLAVACLCAHPAGGGAQDGAATRPPPIARAVEATEQPRIDGVLDDAIWARAEPITDFRQRDPVDGAPATERTELRIAFDSENLYFGLTLFDSRPELIRRSILHREGKIDQDDHVWIALDTYHDRRNAYIFELNPFGTQGDALFTDESMSQDDWNWEGVYRSEARVTDLGWTLEVAIPFTTIRFSEADAPEMGIAVRRAIRRKNEDVYWPHIPQRFRGGIQQVSRYATLTGLRDLRRGRYMELKPFA
ncbi:MAG TPA: carbohydrate binding family 9 domain-containing protein, partial [Longimicrobiales bacterium]|nr:carbohydrate binding family 9 domain-containing protein [Longimicrobiales bacterium]